MSLKVLNYTRSNLAFIPFIKDIIKTMGKAASSLVPSNACGKKIELDETYFNQPGKIECFETFFGVDGTNYVQVLFTDPFSCTIYCNNPELFPKIEAELKTLEREVSDKYNIVLEGRFVRTAK